MELLAAKGGLHAQRSEVVRERVSQPEDEAEQVDDVVEFGVVGHAVVAVFVVKAVVLIHVLVDIGVFAGDTTSAAAVAAAVVVVVVAAAAVMVDYVAAMTKDAH